MTYEQLDTIADIYVPALWILSLIFLLKKLIQDKQTVQIARFLTLPIIVYGCMYLDNCFKFWSSAGLDYSTHTAAALAGCFYLSQVKRFRLPLAISLLVYFILMVYQKYHSWLDILTTSVAVILPILATTLGLNHLEKPGPKYTKSSH